MNLIFQISLILISVTFLAILLKYLKQPLIIAYVFAGIILGPSLLNISVDPDVLRTAQTISLSIILFIFGLKLNTKNISFLGAGLFVSFFLQFIIFFSVMLSFFIFVKMSILESIVISLAVSFSSTIVSSKLLDDKKDSNNLYGKITISFIIFQTIFLVVTYLFLQNYNPNISNEVFLRRSIEDVLKVLIVISNIFLISKYILPRFVKFISSTQDFLIIFALSWGLIVSAGLKYLELPYEIGALISGIFLANLDFSEKLYEKLRYIKDIILLVIFTILGLGLDVKVFQNKIFLILLLILFVFVFRTFLISFALRILSYSRRVSLLSTLSYNHIGEMSLIILGINFINFDSEFTHVFNFLFILTAIISSYFVHYSEKISKIMEPMIGFYLKDMEKEEKPSEIVLFGCGIDGFDFIEEFKKKHFDFIGVDYNPEVIRKLKSKKVNIVFGDAEDKEIFNKLQISKSQLVISTIGDFDTNKFILNELNDRNYKGVRVIYSYSIEESIQLYRLGATFVILPAFLSSHKAADMTATFGISHKNYESEKAKHLEIFNKKLLMSYDYK